MPGKGNPGAYIIIIRLASSQSLRVGMLGEVIFAPGYYAYVGSAMGGLSARLAYHSRPKAKRHWHADHLTGSGEIIDTVTVETGQRVECRLAACLEEDFRSITGFGSSDCRCPSHLFFNQERQELAQAARRAKQLVLAGVAHA